jgi:hypothetical protein
MPPPDPDDMEGLGVKIWIDTNYNAAHFSEE